MTAFAVVNPRSAGGRTGREWPAIERALRSLYPDLHSAMTTARGGATELARDALNEGSPKSSRSAATAPSTRRSTASSMRKAPSRRMRCSASSRAARAAISKTFGIEAGYEAGIAARGTPVHGIDVGRLSCVGLKGEPVVRHFINIGSFGMSGVIVAMVNRARIAKLFGGSFRLCLP